MIPTYIIMKKFIALFLILFLTFATSYRLSQKIKVLKMSKETLISLAMGDRAS